MQSTSWYDVTMASTQSDRQRGITRMARETKSLRMPCEPNHPPDIIVAELRERLEDAERTLSMSERE